MIKRKRSIYNRQYYLNNQEKINKNSKKYLKEYRKKRIEWLNNYKLSRGCSICGYNECASALEFHHLDNNKIFCIGTAIGKTIPIKRIIEELEKCIIICANCHRELHEKCKGGYYDIRKSF